MTIVVMSEKGQVTIPRKFRRKLHIGKGDRLLAEMAEDGGIILRPAAVSPVENYSRRRVAEFEKEDEMGPSESRRIKKALAAGRP